MCDLLHAAPFQNILPRVHVKGKLMFMYVSRGYSIFLACIMWEVPQTYPIISLHPTLMQKGSVWMQRWSVWRPNTQHCIWCLWSSVWEPLRWAKHHCTDSRFSRALLLYHLQRTHLLIVISISNYTLNCCFELIPEPSRLLCFVSGNGQIDSFKIKMVISG